MIIKFNVEGSRKKYCDSTAQLILDLETSKKNKNFYVICNIDISIYPLNNFSIFYLQRFNAFTNIKYLPKAINVLILII